MDDTIAAIATPKGEGGISIIKISGKKSLEILKNIFTGYKKLENRKLIYGYIYEKEIKIDEVLISFMQAPNTYTGENIVEINCHGGILLTTKILNMVIKQGARLAKPGEFTERAFLNGKKNLSEVQTIHDLISAQNESALTIAISTLNKSTQGLVKKLYQELMKIVTNIEVNIDYPEYNDISVVEDDELQVAIIEFQKKIQKIINDSKKGEIIKSGINTALIGKPNTGKSSLLNYLSKRDKAIVTDVEGTTRDIIESKVNLGNIQLNLIDTAGIRQTQDKVEKLGVEKSLEQIEKAELILFITAVNEKLSTDEKNILEKIKEAKKKYIVILNKIDKLNEKNYSKVKKIQEIKEISKEKYMYMSALNNFGEEELEKNIEKEFDLQNFDIFNSVYINQIEVITKLEKIEEIIKKISSLHKEEYLLDLIVIDLKEALKILSDILGIAFNENYLNNMFSKFCLGK